MRRVEDEAGAVVPGPLLPLPLAPLPGGEDGEPVLYGGIVLGLAGPWILDLGLGVAQHWDFLPPSSELTQEVGSPGPGLPPGQASEEEEAGQGGTQGPAPPWGAGIQRGGWRSCGHGLALRGTHQPWPSSCGAVDFFPLRFRFWHPGNACGT